MAKIKRIPIKSSNIVSIGHDEKTNTLEIEFNTGVVYKYTPVTTKEHKLLMSADSIGSYFYRNIRNNKNINTEKVSS